MSRPPDERVARKKALRAAASVVYREAILAAAERVFGRAGFRAAKMIDIGREAGLAAGTLYNYFDSKERIFRSLLEMRAEELLRRLEAVAQVETDPRKRLEGVVRAGLEWLDEHRAMFRIVIELGGMAEWSTRHIAGEKVELTYEDFLKVYARVVADAVSAGVLRQDVAIDHQVAFLTGTMNGFVRTWVVRASNQKLTEAAPLILDLVLNGLGDRR